jgi:hypothetical protein
VDDLAVGVPSQQKISYESMTGSLFSRAHLAAGFCEASDEGGEKPLVAMSLFHEVFGERREVEMESLDAVCLEILGD